MLQTEKETFELLDEIVSNISVFLVPEPVLDLCLKLIQVQPPAP